MRWIDQQLGQDFIRAKHERMRPSRKTPLEVESINREWGGLAAGDVIKWPTGTLRVVRDVNPHLNPLQTYVSLTKLKCGKFGKSGSCWTEYTIGDLRSVGAQRVSARASFTHPLDIAINAEIQRGPVPSEMMQLKCCDVKGIS